MKICFAAIPGYGHVFPMVPLAAAAQLVKRAAGG